MFSMLHIVKYLGCVEFVTIYVHEMCYFLRLLIVVTRDQRKWDLVQNSRN